MKRLVIVALLGIIGLGAVVGCSEKKSDEAFPSLSPCSPPAGKSDCD